MAGAYHYALALGSNRRHAHYGAPANVLAAALCALEAARCEILEVAKTMHTNPVGPSSRRYANNAALITTDKEPQELLTLCKVIESQFGRRIGQRWSQRTLDIDLILWSGGSFVAPELVIPHTLFRARDFVLKPLATIIPDWRDPLTNFTIRQLLAQLQKKNAKVVDHCANPD